MNSKNITLNKMATIYALHEDIPEVHQTLFLIAI